MGSGYLVIFEREAGTEVCILRYGFVHAYIHIYIYTRTVKLDWDFL